MVLFVNGIPLIVMELKNPANENAPIWDAYNQLRTYKEQISTLFRCLSSAMLQARAGTITSEPERFMQWKTINAEKPEKDLIEIEVLLEGMFDKARILDIIRNFIVFEKDKETKKKLAAYHQ